MFSNRTEAGQKLAATLSRFKTEQPLILALPRGGVPIGYEVAKALDTDLDVVISRKIGTPGQPELALGAVVGGKKPEVVLNDDIMRMTSPSVEYLESEKEVQLQEIRRREKTYRGNRPKPDIHHRTVIVVDDGIATGATVRAALHALRRGNPRRLILAVPVAPADTIEAMRSEADEVICLETPEPFYAISLHYGAFPQVGDHEVSHLLSKNWARTTQIAHSPANDG